jgi:hypothetical protein
MICPSRRSPRRTARPRCASVQISMQAKVIGHLLPQAAHQAHVLHVVAAVDHRAGREEQARLEEGVRGHVEHAGHDARRARPPATMKPSCEIGRVGEHRLQVVAVVPIVAAKSAVVAPTIVHHAQHRSARARGTCARAGTRPPRPSWPRGSSAETGVGAGHRVGQPDVQRELRRLADSCRRRRTARPTSARPGTSPPFAATVLARGSHSSVKRSVWYSVHSMKIPTNRQHVADARRQEGLLAGPRRPAVEERLRRVVAKWPMSR